MQFAIVANLLCTHACDACAVDKFKTKMRINNALTRILAYSFRSGLSFNSLQYMREKIQYYALN